MWRHGSVAVIESIDRNRISEVCDRKIESMTEVDIFDVERKCEFVMNDHERKKCIKPFWPEL